MLGTDPATELRDSASTIAKDLGALCTLATKSDADQLRMRIDLLKSGMSSVDFEDSLNPNRTRRRKVMDNKFEDTDFASALHAATDHDNHEAIELCIGEAIKDWRKNKAPHSTFDYVQMSIRGWKKSFYAKHIGSKGIAATIENMRKFEPRTTNPFIDILRDSHKHNKFDCFILVLQRKFKAHKRASLDMFGPTAYLTIGEEEEKEMLIDLDDAPGRRAFHPSAKDLIASQLDVAPPLYLDPEHASAMPLSTQIVSMKKSYNYYSAYLETFKHNVATALINRMALYSLNNLYESPSKDARRYLAYCGVPIGGSMDSGVVLYSNDQFERADYAILSQAFQTLVGRLIKEPNALSIGPDAPLNDATEQL